MGAKSMWIFISIFITFHCASCEHDNTETLRNLHIFFRHGDRSPLNIIQGDLAIEHLADLSLEASLTNAGKNRMYRMGQRLRHIYSTFIPEEFSDDFVYTYSTDQARTLMSAELVLAGLYPPKGSQVWMEGMNWQPIPVHTKPIKSDPFYPLASCDRAFSDLINAHSLPEVREILRDNSDMLTFLENQTGMPVSSNLVAFVLLVDSLKTMMENNQTLPKWAEEINQRDMTDLFLFSIRFTVFTDDLKRLRVGPLLEHLTTPFKNYRDGIKMQPQLNLYSVHDVNVFYLGETLGLFPEPFQPDYGAALIFELHENHYHAFTVKISLLSGPDLEALIIPGCTQYCPLDYFINVSAHFIPTDWKSECQTNPTVNKSPVLTPPRTCTYEIIITIITLTMRSLQQ